MEKQTKLSMPLNDKTASTCPLLLTKRKTVYANDLQVAQAQRLISKYPHRSALIQNKDCPEKSPLDQQSAAPADIYHRLTICKYVTNLKVKTEDLISHY